MSEKNSYHIHYEVFREGYIVWRKVDIPDNSEFIFGRYYSELNIVSKEHIRIYTIREKNLRRINFLGSNGTFIYEYGSDNVIGTIPIMLRVLNKPGEKFDDDFSKYIGKWLQLAGNTDIQSESNYWDWGTRIVICENNQCYNNILPDFIYSGVAEELLNSISNKNITADYLYRNISNVCCLFRLKRFETHLIDFLKLSSKKVSLNLGQVRDARKNSKSLREYITKIYYSAQNIKSIDGDVRSYHEERIECLYKLLLEENISIPENIFSSGEIDFLRKLC